MLQRLRSRRLSRASTTRLATAMACCVLTTAFTFLGGAIGVGFGSQNILNNFISGLILLAERPIKVGDLIQLGETYGNITKIRPRLPAA